MTTTRSTVRRLSTVAASLTSLAAVALVLAGPASAEPSQGWPDSLPQSPIRTILILGGIPLLLFLLITLSIYLPAIARGERVTPGASPVEDQWLGGPRKAHGELAGPDTETSEAGGAGARW